MHSGSRIRLLPLVRTRYRMWPSPSLGINLGRRPSCNQRPLLLNHSIHRPFHLHNPFSSIRLHYHILLHRHILHLGRRFLLLSNRSIITSTLPLSHIPHITPVKPHIPIRFTAYLPVDNHSPCRRRRRHIPLHLRPRHRRPGRDMRLSTYPRLHILTHPPQHHLIPIRRLLPRAIPPHYHQSANLSPIKSTTEQPTSSLTSRSELVPQLPHTRPSGYLPYSYPRPTPLRAIQPTDHRT